MPKNVIKLHDKKSPLLLGHLKDDDNLIDTNVIRYIEPKQTTLFDFCYYFTFSILNRMECNSNYTLLNNSEYLSADEITDLFS